MANVECIEVVIDQCSVWLRLVHQNEANESRPILGDFRFAGSDAECALVGEKRRRAACVQILLQKSAVTDGCRSAIR